MECFSLTIGCDHWAEKAPFIRNLLGVVLMLRNKKTLRSFGCPLGLLKVENKTDELTRSKLVDLLRKLNLYEAVMTDKIGLVGDNGIQGGLQ